MTMLSPFSRARFTYSPLRHRRAPAPFRLAAALAIAAALCVAPVWGEAAADEGRSVASHIPAAAADPVRPVTVIDREDIALSGMRTVSDLLLGRLAVNGFGLGRPFVLGSGRAAVLINGRRISDSTLDLATLPTSAVERVEVLNGGAPALHGGHAIAGAVNIVLRRGYEGVEATAFAGRPTDAGGDSEQGSALWGGAVGKGRMTIGVDVFRSEEIPDAAREHSRAKWTPGGTFADATGVSTGGNTVRIPTADGTIARPLGDCPTDTYTGELAEPSGLDGTGCGFAYADISWGVARYERESLFLTLDHPLNETTDAYIDARFATSETLERFAPSVGTFDVDFDTLRGELLPDSDISPEPDEVRVSHRFIGHGNREWLTTLDEYDITLGLEGKVDDDIGYDAHLRHYLHEMAIDGNTFVSESDIEARIEAGDYDLVNPRDPANSGTIRDSSLRLIRERVTERRTVHASLDGPLVALGGGTARWAAGAEVAAEDWKDVHAYRNRFDRSFPATDVLGAGGIQGEGERRSWSGFAEASLPLRDDWDVTIAGRGSDHDDVGATYSHQVASRFRVNDALTLRGAWDKGSRAPSLHDLHFSRNDFPWLCDRVTHTDPQVRCPIEQKERISRGNPDLEPDKAESFSLGAAAELGSLSLSADWFRIALSDVPGELSPQSIIDLEDRNALPPGVRVVRDSGGEIDRIESPVLNSGEFDMSGVDVRARIGWDVDWADLVLDLRWLHESRRESRVLGELQPGDNPRNRVHGSLRANRGNVTALWDVHAVSGFLNERGTGRFKGLVTHDIAVRWSDPLGLGGMDLTGGILNVADRGPSIDPTAPDAAFGTQDTVRGRTFFLNATMAW